MRMSNDSDLKEMQENLKIQIVNGKKLQEIYLKKLD
jgi:hypothetical protein